MDDNLKKYLWDILQAIDGLEKGAPISLTLEQFSTNEIILRATERNFEIIGEALKRALLIRKDLPISNTRKIIGMRNIISHNYDSVEPVNLWGALKKNIPILKSEILRILNESI